MKYLFGPVPSRRLGRSLGVDLVPLKTCSYDCVYCQLGRTTEKTIVRKAYTPIDEVLGEIETILPNSDSNIDYITFSGSGEPTLHSQIGQAIEKIKQMTEIPVAVLTNGSLLYQSAVREGLYKADLVIPSLDTVSEDIFQNINRPHSELRLSDIIHGIKYFTQTFDGDVWLEVLFVEGLNNSDKAIQNLAETIKAFKLKTVHINTVVRPPAEPDVVPLTSQEQIDKIVTALGHNAKIIGDFSARAERKGDSTNAYKQIYEAISRRPVTVDDLSASLGFHPQEVIKNVETLLNEGLIQTTYHHGFVYYQLKD